MGKIGYVSTHTCELIHTNKNAHTYRERERERKREREGEERKKKNINKARPTCQGWVKHFSACEVLNHFL